MERMLDPGAMQSARVRTFRRHDGLAHIDPPTALTPKRAAQQPEVERLRLLAPRMIEAGQTEDVLAWINELPLEMQTDEPWVLHFLGIVLRLSNEDPARAFGIQEEAREAFFQAENWTGYARTLTELGLLAALLEQQSSTHLHAAPTDWSAPPEHGADGDDPLLGRDESIRARLRSAIADGRITLHGLRLLRSDYALTPAETNVFISYYLPKNEMPVTGTTRRDLSNTLNLSENTLMHHISSIRRKLGFGSRRGSANVLLWCVSAGITNLHTVSEPVTPAPTPISSRQQPRIREVGKEE